MNTEKPQRSPGTSEASTASKLVGIFIILFVVLLLVLIVAEAGLRFRHELILGRPLCAQNDKVELMSLKANCEAWEDSPAGPYKVQTNEDGFRDRPHIFFNGGTFFLVGDSHAEGFRLPENQSLSRRLEETLGARVLNLGMQGTGSSQQALRIRRAIEKNYKPLGVIWLLNPSDPIDDVFFGAIEGGEPNPLANPAFRSHPISILTRITGGRSRLVQKASEMLLLQKPYSEFMKGRDFNPATHCKLLHSVVKLLSERKVPVVFVVMGHGPKGTHLIYRGVEPNEADFEKLLTCVAKTGLPSVDLRGVFEEPALYWKGDWHFTPEGTVKLAELLAERLKPLLKLK